MLLCSDVAAALSCRKLLFSFYWAFQMFVPLVALLNVGGTDQKRYAYDIVIDVMLAEIAPDCLFRMRPRSLPRRFS